MIFARCLSRLVVLLALLVILKGDATTDALGDEVSIFSEWKLVAQVHSDLDDVVESDSSAIREAEDLLRASLLRSARSFDERAPGSQIVLCLFGSKSIADVEVSLGESYESYALVTRGDTLYIIGRSGVAVRHGVADFLHRLGFRFYAPSRRWHAVPLLKDKSVELNVSESPALRSRRIWYAYGMPGDDLKSLSEDARRWQIANRLSVDQVVSTGHSYGNIIGRNRAAFEKHPEYFALLVDGTRDTKRPENARKFCFSNPGLIDLVCEDRKRLLQENLTQNRYSTMVSVDPSDGEGTCHCESCKAIGSTTDRVFFLANAVARAVRDVHPNASVGLYAYSSHRLPPSIEVESNVYVQVAMGFNRTKFTLAELVEQWSKKVDSIGLREYYGVEAWDWGLPGRMRGGRTSYHKKWIPYFANRNLDAINAETNANWGGQMLGLSVAASMMWDPNVDTDSIRDEFFERCFGAAAVPMKRVYAAFDESPPLRASSLLPIFVDVAEAWKMAESPDSRSRVVDVMAYLLYVAEFRDFDLVQRRETERNESYYDALEPLMNYAWLIRHRDMVHYYALARRFCNGLPRQDERLDFYYARREKPPIWMRGEAPTDKEIVLRFASRIRNYREDKDPTVTFSRLFEKLSDAGDGGNASRGLGRTEQGIGKFRGSLRGQLLADSAKQVSMSFAPSSRTLVVEVGQRGQDAFNTVSIEKSEEFQKWTVDLPRAGEYWISMNGDFLMKV